MYVDTTATNITIEPQCEYFVGYGNYFLLPIVCKETHLIISLKTILFLALFVCSEDNDTFQFTGTKG